MSVYLSVPSIHTAISLSAHGSVFPPFAFRSFRLLIHFAIVGSSRTMTPPAAILYEAAPDFARQVFYCDAQAISVPLVGALRIEFLSEGRGSATQLFVQGRFRRNAQLHVVCV